jgi:hypothetical protein
VKLRLDVKHQTPAAPQPGPTTPQPLDEVSKAVGSAAASIALPPAEDARDELKEASRSNRSRREHDQLAAHDRPAPGKAKPRSRKQT